jgi:hypothetical protein
MGPFQTANEWWPNLQKVPRRWRISHAYPMWLCGHNFFKISSPGPVLQGTKWLLWRLHIQSPTLPLRCGIKKTLIKRGSTRDHWRLPTPHTYIRTYIQPQFALIKTNKINYVGSEVLTSVVMKCSISTMLMGSDMFLRNNARLSMDYMAL